MAQISPARVAPSDLLPQAKTSPKSIIENIILIIMITYFFLFDILCNFERLFQYVLDQKASYHLANRVYLYLQLHNVVYCQNEFQLRKNGNIFFQVHHLTSL